MDKERKIASHGFVKTEGFEKTVALIMTITQEAWRIMQDNKSFRLEINYDAEALNTEYEFCITNDKCVSDDTSQES